MSAVAPSLPEDGARRHTTVARTNGSPRADSSAASPEDVRLHEEAPAFAFSSASQTFADVTGMSMFFTPACQSASITALTYAAGEPTVADSPTPFAPIGWCGDGVTVSGDQRSR